MAHVRFWNYKTNRGRMRNVKNLGWLIAHGSECEHVEIGLDAAGQLFLLAHGHKGDEIWTYTTPVASYRVMRYWVNRPSLSHVSHVYRDTENDYCAVTEAKHQRTYGELGTV